MKKTLFLIVCIICVPIKALSLPSDANYFIYFGISIVEQSNPVIVESLIETEQQQDYFQEKKGGDGHPEFRFYKKLDKDYLLGFSFMTSSQELYRKPDPVNPLLCFIFLPACFENDPVKYISIDKSSLSLSAMYSPYDEDGVYFRVDAGLAELDIEVGLPSSAQSSKHYGLHLLSEIGVHFNNRSSYDIDFYIGWIYSYTLINNDSYDEQGINISLSFGI